MSLFEPLPADAEVESLRPPRPDWAGPPQAHFAGIAPMRRVLASRDGDPAVVIELVAVRAYQQGCLFDIVATAFQPGTAPWRDQHPMQVMMRRLRPGEALPDDLLRFAVVLPDGRVATTVHTREHHARLLHADQRPPRAAAADDLPGRVRWRRAGRRTHLGVPGPAVALAGATRR